MEQAYLDFDPQSPSPQRDVSMNKPTATFPPTASTQRAEVDSQSQVDMQLDTDRGNDAHDDEIRKEIHKNHRLTVEKDDLQDDLKKAKTHIKELEAALTAIRQDGRDMHQKMFADKVKKLEAEVEQWKKRYHILFVKDQRTNDDVRSRAALEPELRAENVRLLGELDRLEEDHVKVLRENQRLLGLLADVCFVCQHMEDGKHCHARFHDEEGVRNHAYDTHYSHLKAFQHS